MKTWWNKNKLEGNTYEKNKSNGINFAVVFFERWMFKQWQKEIELIKSSLEAQEYFQTNEYKIEDVKLHSSEEKDNTKVDTCTIVFSNDVVRYTTDFEFKFANYSNHWELTEYDAINEKNNKSEPVSGVTEENIKKMLKNQELSVANVIFNKNQMYPATVSIDSQKTDLKKGIDSVICSFKMKTEYLSVDCNVKIQCKFDKNSWKLVSMKDTGKSVMKLNDEINGYSKFSVTDDTIKKCVENQLYSGYGDDGLLKNQSFVKGNISNFKVKNKIYTDKGKTFYYPCTLDYHTAMANLKINCDLFYHFDETKGWSDGSVYSEVMSATPNDLVGTWSGKKKMPYFDTTNVTLIIDKMKDSGDFKGTYHVVETDYFGKTKMDKTFKVEGKFKFEDKKVEYDVDVADGNSSDGRVITIEMDPNSNSMILIDSKASNKVPITKQ